MISRTLLARFGWILLMPTLAFSLWILFAGGGAVLESPIWVKVIVGISFASTFLWSLWRWRDERRRKSDV